MTDLLLTDVRLVPLADAPAQEAATPETVDVLVRDGVVHDVAPGLDRTAVSEVVAGDGRWLMPGLWDQHVHMSQWAQTVRRLDLSGAASANAVIARLAGYLEESEDAIGASVLFGFGYRSSRWPVPATVAQLDAVTGDRPVVLISGDCHSGWLNSAAQSLLGAPRVEGALDESEWFAIYARLPGLPGAAAEVEAGYADVLADAARRGVVGVTDMEFDSAAGAWPVRFGTGLDTLRIRTAVYPEGLAAVIESGLRTGEPWEGTYGLATMGPLKVISDGALGTRTAHCHDPYPDLFGSEFPRGKQNFSLAELTDLLGRATANGLSVAVHSIGDAALDIALDAIEATGARGGIEHAQLSTPAQRAKMAALGLRASVQPAHLLDDRDAAAELWPGRESRCFAFRSMLDAGIELVMGSDAPVARLDPWLGMAAAVHRSADDRPPWNPSEAITPREALAASTDGWGTVAPGHPGDLMLLDYDPLLPSAAGTEEQAARLRWMTVSLTTVAGRIVHR